MFSRSQVTTYRPYRGSAPDPNWFYKHSAPLELKVKPIVQERLLGASDKQVRHTVELKVKPIVQERLLGASDKQVRHTVELKVKPIVQERLLCRGQMVEATRSDRS